jgi:hypothetical protein
LGTVLEEAEFFAQESMCGFIDAFLRDAAERTGSTIISGHCAELQARAGNS